MSLRVGCLTRVICCDCGRRCRIRSIVSDEEMGLWLEFECSSLRCTARTAMPIGGYMAYGVKCRRMDMIEARGR